MTSGIDNKYPLDTAILIDNRAYQINTVSCAQIKAIGSDGALDCYDSAGQKTSLVTPISDWRRNYIKEKMGMEWASEKHQNFLFYMFHGGGNEKLMGAAVNSAQQAYGNYANTKNMIDSLGKSKEIDQQNAQMKIKGMSAYMTGGMPAWQAHQMNVIQWRLDNSRYFSNQMNKSNH
ncbi:hypothetical protein [Janthinobacterium sp. CG_23.3]|uniref:hypothetical protein n=1 Tax=Janthinobacterium sp. CG_23.3 TaxID=3349634 RepID=UPI0038D46810